MSVPIGLSKWGLAGCPEGVGDGGTGRTLGEWIYLVFVACVVLWGELDNYVGRDGASHGSRPFGWIGESSRTRWVLPGASRF